MKEAALLAQCKQYLSIVKRYHNLTFRRIHVVPIPRGKFGSGFSKNVEMCGMSDLLVFLPEGKTLHVECKSDSGVLNPDQKRWQMELERVGHPYLIVRNLDHLIAKLEEFGIPNFFKAKRAQA